MLKNTLCGCPTQYYGPALQDFTRCYGNAFVFFMAIVDSIIRDNCQINSPCDRITPTTVPDLRYDFIVVGGGSAGSVVAGRLAEVKDWKVLLVEAGDDEPPGAQVPSLYNGLTGSAIDWNYKTEPEPVGCRDQPGRRCTWPRGKALGGTGLFNGMAYCRPTPKDIERWVAAGNPDWSYDKLMPVFKKSQDNKQVGTLVDSKYHGTGGPWVIQQFNDQPPIAWDIQKGANQTGIGVSNDLNDFSQLLGVAVMQANVKDGQRFSTAKAYLRPHKQNPNLHIILNATAIRILVKKIGNKTLATGIELVKANRRYSVLTKKEVILCAGAVATPQILLLSGIGDKRQLDKVGIQQVHNLPAVGKGLQNHVSFRMEYAVNVRDTALMNWYTLNEYVRSGRGPLSGTGLQQIGARVSTNYTTPDDPDIQFFFDGYMAECAYNGDLDAPTNPFRPNAPRTVSILPCNNHPRSKGYLGLRSRNPSDPPVIVANYLTDEHDIKVLLGGIRLAQKLASAPILRSKYGFVLIRKSYGKCNVLYKFDSDEFWICAIKYAHLPENHQGSSCKMGPANQSETCVNQKLQLHGIDNLRIADASIYPTLPSCNPQGTVVMIAERAVEFIREKYNE